jgi:CubicO group peptidase (beta-lactamase class C family)
MSDRIYMLAIRLGSSLLLLLCLLYFPGCSRKAADQFLSDNEGISVATLREAQVDSTVISAVDTAVSNGTFPNIHSLLVAKDTLLIFEKYWSGKDEVWGTSVGVVPHSKDSLHDIRSISKSVVSACVGIALEQGKIKSVHQKVFDFFPEHARLDTGRKSLLTIEHLLTMSSGFKWNEDVPYTDPENSEVKMINSGNPIEFVLSQPMEHSPGQQWQYNGGTTQLLAAIIEKTSGQKVAEFADKNLFQPLGISNFEWVKYPGIEEYAAASGLRLRSRDLLKFGLLYLKDGRWHGKQLIPEKWVEASIKPNLRMDEFTSYGYQFWLWEDQIMGKKTTIIACVGNGDQRIFIDKQNNVVTVVTAGNYNLWDIENDAGALVRQYVYSSFGR